MNSFNWSCVSSESTSIRRTFIPGHTAEGKEEGVKGAHQSTQLPATPLRPFCSKLLVEGKRKVRFMVIIVLGECRRMNVELLWAWLLLFSFCSPTLTWLSEVGLPLEACSTETPAYCITFSLAPEPGFREQLQMKPIADLNVVPTALFYSSFMCRGPYIISKVLGD